MSERNAEQVDPGRVLSSIGWPAPVASARVTGGWDTELWRVTLPDGRDRALRVYRVGSNPLAAEREAGALRMLTAGAIPSPRVEATGVFDSRSFLLLSWLRGAPMLDTLSSRPWQIWRLGRTLGRLQARIHTLPPPVADPASGLDWVDAAGIPSLAAAVRDAAGPPAFCHGDFHPANVMVAPAGITGVIDLPNTMAADRRADLAITETILLRAPLPPVHPLRPVFQAMRGVLARAWRAGYRAEAGEFPLTPLFQAWGAAYWLRGLEAAVRDGRGWGTVDDIAALHRYIDHCMASAVRLPTRDV